MSAAGKGFSRAPAPAWQDGDESLKQPGCTTKSDRRGSEDGMRGTGLVRRSEACMKQRIDIEETRALSPLWTAIPMLLL